MQLFHGTEANNLIVGSNEERKFHVMPSGKITNPMEDDMAIIHCICITID